MTLSSRARHFQPQLPRPNVAAGPGRL